jgi:hypothetical protein
VNVSGGWAQVAAPIDYIPLHVRAGSVIPMQLPGLTTTESRKNNFTLLIALAEVQSILLLQMLYSLRIAVFFFFLNKRLQDSSSLGELYLDDGVSVTVNAASYYAFFAQYRLEYAAAKTRIEDFQFYSHRILLFLPNAANTWDIFNAVGSSDMIQLYLWTRSLYALLKN